MAKEELVNIVSSLKFNNEGHLTIGECDCIELVKLYGTPLYVSDKNIIRNNCRIYTNALNKYYNGKGLILFAGKAFCTMAMCKIVQQEGLGLDIVSGGELYTAWKARFPMDKVYFHGNNKTIDELELAIEFNVGRIVVDNLNELNNICMLASKKNKKIDILLRVTPGIEAHTHEFICTGKQDSKFGFSLQSKEAEFAIKYALKSDWVNVTGIHCHIGSQIFELTPFKRAVQLLMDFIIKIKVEMGLSIEELNLGGGYGIRYLQEDKTINYDLYVKEIANTLDEICQQYNTLKPSVIMEPGRSIVGPAGITLYTIGNIKDIEGIRKYVCVDGGMTDNPRYIMYQAKYSAVLANRSQDNQFEVVTVAGKCCESGDVLIKDISLNKAVTGDILAVLGTGAYNYSMASNYNRIPRPAVVLVNGKNHNVIVKRESYEDITANDVIPESLL